MSVEELLFSGQIGKLMFHRELLRGLDITTFQSITKDIITLKAEFSENIITMYCVSPHFRKISNAEIIPTYDISVREIEPDDYYGAMQFDIKIKEIPE